MEKEDFASDEPGCRRIDAAIAALKHFMQHQHASGAASDTYTLAAVNREITVVFECKRYADAMKALDRAAFEPGYSIDYAVVVEAISRLCRHRQRSRVIFVSDGCKGHLRRTTLPGFQEVVRADPNLMVHTFGLGCCDFSTLQQLAQIGRGSFLWASMDMNGLINTFTTVSKTITQTRTAGNATERRQRAVTFEDAQKWTGRRDRACGFMKFEHGPRNGTRTTYCLSSRTRTNSDRRSSIRIRQLCEGTEVYISPDPFMVGGMRLVYQFLDVSMPKRMVAKCSKYAEDDDSKSFAETFIHNTICARTFSGQFHNDVSRAATQWGRWREPPRLVSCVQCWLYELGERAFTAEMFLEGSQQGFL
eukprot:2083050-Amphidinium_carterae.1